MEDLVQEKSREYVVNLRNRSNRTSDTSAQGALKVVECTRKWKCKTLLRTYAHPGLVVASLVYDWLAERGRILFESPVLVHEPPAKWTRTNRTSGDDPGRRSRGSCFANAHSVLTSPWRCQHALVKSLTTDQHDVQAEVPSFWCWVSSPTRCRSEGFPRTRMTKRSCACNCGRGPVSVDAFFFLLLLSFFLSFLLSFFLSFFLSYFLFLSFFLLFSSFLPFFLSSFLPCFLSFFLSFFLLLLSSRFVP